MIFLFEFSFSERTVNSYLFSWMKQTQTDYIYLGQTMYADIYGIGEYYRIVTEHISGDVFEVYADTSKAATSTLERMFPLTEKAVSVQEPLRTVKLIFSDGTDTTMKVNLCSKEAKKNLLGRSFKTPNGIQAVTELLFVA